MPLSEKEELEYLELKGKGGATTPPTLRQRFQAGITEKPIDQPKGFELGDIAEFAGQALPTAIGATAGTFIAGPGPGTAVGAAGGRAWQKVGVQAVGAVKPGFAPQQSPLNVVGDVALTGVMQGAGDIAAPYVGAGLRWTGTKVAQATPQLIKDIPKYIGTGIKKSVSGLSTVSTEAIDAAINKGEQILKYVGLSADELADKGQDIQALIKQGKGAMGEFTRELLGKRYDALKSAGESIGQHLEFMRAGMVARGQQLQAIIPTIKERAGAEYQKIIRGVLSTKGKYKLDPGAAYPFTLDFKKGLMNTIKQVRDDFGYGNPTRTPDPVGQDIFQIFANRIGSLGKASIDDAFYLQKDLGNAIWRNRGTESAAALRTLRDGVFKVLDGVPEFKQANTTYRAGMELLEDLGGMESADDLSKMVLQAFKTGGNKRDALLRFGAADPNANKIIKGLVDASDNYAKIEAKGQTISKMAQGIEKLKDTYSLGDAKKAMIGMAQRDPVIANILKINKDAEQVYSRLSALMNTDRVYSRIMNIMSKGGNQKDAIAALSKSIPNLSAKVAELQDAIMGQEFKPLFRAFPQTGMGIGLFGGLGVAAAKFPLGLVAAPLLSPRLVGLGAKATGQAIRGVQRAAQAPLTKAVGKGIQETIRPLPGTVAYEIFRRKYPTSISESDRKRYTEEILPK